MRVILTAVAATFLLMPAVHANACGAKPSAQAAATELSAEEKKPVAKKKKKVKKEKVEYMRAAPMK
jgi:hypothetical protein